MGRQSAQKHRRRAVREARWSAFEPAVVGSVPPALAALVDRQEALYVNNRYQVAVRRLPPCEGWPALIHLSIKRLDRAAIHDWRDLQRIKNELVGPEHEAVELYPAESRLVDTSNQYHLVCCADPTYRFPFGWHERLVSDATVYGTVQRPWAPDERPSDCLDRTALERRIHDARRRGATT